MNNVLIPRMLRSQVEEHLALFPAVGILGPRQVGKTTLARAITDARAETSHGEPGRSEGGLYLDLENPADLSRLAEGSGYLDGVTDRLVVLDEIQRAPGLFRELRGIIDRRIRRGERAGQFLILGSASLDLLRQSGESLAGRIGYLELGPLDVREVEESRLLRLWSRGGFPPSFLAPSDGASALWRENFIRTYLERDIPQLGPRIPAQTLRRFWTMLAHSQGGLLNASQLAGSLAVDGKTIAKYVDLMVDLLLVRRLQPIHANVRKRLVKSPKIYLRDSGILHALLGIPSLDALLGHPVAGTSWEGFVIETLIRAAPDSLTPPGFYRTATGVEIDLILDVPGSLRWAIEVKRGLAPRVGKGFRIALEDVKADRAFVVYGGDDRYPVGGGVEVIGLRELATELAALVRE
ncbi:ATP-binding protein [Candidatus Palauibacter sp.]|uniref:ATP-binding protein n=1 Tax=Candidatus Palauibacter sp. TaxID=3101350 RepID=UPI003D0DE399